jgi:hypothetical protein
VNKQKIDDIDHNAVIRLQNMLKVPLTLLICFIGLISHIASSNPRAAGALMIVVLMLLSIACIGWGWSLYRKIHKIDKLL